jgi:hypothetical protein
VWITGIGNPTTFQLALENNFGFNYFGWFGAKLTGRRIFERFWEMAFRLNVPQNPYRMGFMQTVCAEMPWHGDEKSPPRRPSGLCLLPRRNCLRCNARLQTK